MYTCSESETVTVTWDFLESAVVVLWYNSWIRLPSLVSEKWGKWYMNINLVIQ